MPLAIGYVPWQQWRKIYDPADGLANGTIFPELNLQFYGCIPQGCAKGGRL
ncbi:spore coat associated protein CotJA [Roseburia sp. AM59-24XD]|nr:spore coat associated protein CotJA [Roseburia sp. AM59-24XD]